MKLHILVLIISVLTLAICSSVREPRRGIYRPDVVHTPKLPRDHFISRHPVDRRDAVYRKNWAKLPRPYRPRKGDHRYSGSPRKLTVAPVRRAFTKRADAVPPEARYAILKKAAGTKALTTGKRYAILEKAKITTRSLHHRLVVGNLVLAHDGTGLNFINTEYWEVTKDGTLSGKCKISSGTWMAKSSAGYNVEFLGSVKPGANLAQETAAVMGGTAAQYNLGASVGLDGNNCQTYAKNLWERIKE